MKLGSKYDQLDTPRNLKYKQIYWSKYLQIVEKSSGSSTVQYQTIIFSEQLTKLKTLELTTQRMHYQPLFTRYSCRKMAGLETCKFVKKTTFFFSIKLLHAHVH